MMLPHDNADALEEHVCPDCGLKHTHKFQWDKGKFWVGKVKNKFIAWCYYMLVQTVILFITLLHPKITTEFTGIIIIVSAVVTFIFMLAGAIDMAVANMKIIAELKYGAQKNVNTNN